MPCDCFSLESVSADIEALLSTFIYLLSLGMRVVTNTSCDRFWFDSCSSFVAFVGQSSAVLQVNVITGHLKPELL